MAWSPWLWLKAGHTGNTVLKHCDAAGEAIASFLGITSPKYAYEISIHERMQADEARRAKRVAEEASLGWTALSQDDQQQAVVDGALTAVTRADGADRDVRHHDNDGAATTVITTQVQKF